MSSTPSIGGRRFFNLPRGDFYNHRLFDDGTAAVSQIRIPPFHSSWVLGSTPILPDDIFSAQKLTWQWLMLFYAGSSFITPRQQE